MNNEFNLNHLYFLAQGAGWTVILSLMAFVGGGLLGFGVALARISRSRALRWLALGYVQLVQGTPLLILMFLSYFGLSIMGLSLPAIVAAGLSMTIYVSAYIGEIWRGCIEAVPKTQWEAAECLALTRTQRLFMVILPQALRIATPPTVGFMVQIVKNTSLASVVGFVELARAGQIINNSLFEPFVVYMLVAGLYFLLCFPLSWWARKLENRLLVGRKPEPEMKKGVGNVQYCES
ncbi:polar amino acid transport system permease protein [Polaromonas sp. OV174]|uniref:amino acid ABC transporter permease n=1 Tax=Polaromonas sp. OV174 TaxID=1855300 RepID=UPI0008ECF0E7|nr:amino acid ABC transporter permease [Polaromonas sp. OV174]SFC78663.1 polar amino acid transport system permease protein [Polaromonas sp. OV174]